MVRRRAWLCLFISIASVAPACSKRSSEAAHADAAPRLVERPPRKGRALPPLPSPLPGARTAFGIGAGSTLVAAGDVDGDGKTDLVFADAKNVRVSGLDGLLEAKVESVAAPQVLVVGDADGDGKNEVLVGWGSSIDFRDAVLRFSSFHLDGKGGLAEEVIVMPRSSRQSAITIQPPAPGAPGLLLAWFESKYATKAARATRAPDGKWTLAPVADLPMATSWARGDADADGTTDLVVGRVYGDAVASDGDAFILRPDGTRTPIPTVRGLRSLALIDGDGDGQPEVWFGDGWDKDYGKIARGQLYVARWTKDGFETELIEDTEGQSAIMKIFAADVDGDEDLEIITVGSDYVRVFKREDTWRGLTIAGETPDATAVDVDGDGAMEIVLAGEKPEIVSLKAVKWP